MFASEQKEECVKSEEFVPPAVLRSVDWLMFIIFIIIFTRLGTSTGPRTNYFDIADAIMHLYMTLID